jgi:hypothetical protein
MTVEYLALKPLIGRTRYEPIIVAIARNTPPGEMEIDGYQITLRQMKGRHIPLRIYTNLMSLRLMKLRYLLWLSKRIGMAIRGYRLQTGP